MFTINDVEKSNYVEFKKNLINQHMMILRKYLNYFEISKLKSGFFTWIGKKFTCKKFRKTKGTVVETNIRYGEKKLEIPLEFDTLMSAILSKDLTIPGLFRVSAPFAKLNEVELSLLKMFDSSELRNTIMEFLVQYDVVLLCNLFSRMFCHFNTTLFPREFLDISIKMSQITNAQDQYICFKVLLAAFPYAKRTLFESVGKFVKLVSEEHIKFDEKHIKTMNLNGICKVLTPKIFLNKDEKMDPARMIEYVKILDFIYENMENIIQIDKT